jgi:cephalosporin-C deacetylase-like acetyl esterase
VSDVKHSRPIGKNRGYNSSGIMLDHEPGVEIIEVIDTSGESITPDYTPGKIGSQILSNVDNKTEFISFSVYPDSYREFNIIKSFFVNNNYEYSWVRNIHGGTIRIVAVDKLEVQ